MNYNISNMSNIKFKKYNNSPISLSKLYYEPYGQDKVQVWPPLPIETDWAIKITNMNFEPVYRIYKSDYPSFTNLGNFTTYSNREPDIDELFIGDPSLGDNYYCAYSKINGHWRLLDLAGFGVTSDIWDPTQVFLNNQIFLVNVIDDTINYDDEVASICSGSAVYHLIPNGINCVISGYPSSFISTDVFTITITPNTNCYLPSAITVQNADYVYNQQAGTCQISNAIGNVTVTVNAIEQYRVTKTSNPSAAGTWTGSDWLEANNSRLYEITPKSSYMIQNVSINPSNAATLRNSATIRYWTLSNPFVNFSLDALFVSHPVHTWQNYYSISSTQHARSCVNYPACTGQQIGAHNPGGIYQFNTSRHWQLCEQCGYNGSYNLGVHNWSDVYIYNATTHWKECNQCLATNQSGAHSNWNNGYIFVNHNMDGHNKSIYNKCGVCDYNNWNNTYENHHIKYGNWSYSYGSWNNISTSWVNINNDNHRRNWTNSRTNTGNRLWTCNNGCGFSYNEITTKTDYSNRIETQAHLKTTTGWGAWTNGDWTEGQWVDNWNNTRTYDNWDNHWYNGSTNHYNARVRTWENSMENTGWQNHWQNSASTSNWVESWNNTYTDGPVTEHWNNTYEDVNVVRTWNNTAYNDGIIVYNWNNYQSNGAWSGWSYYNATHHVRSQTIGNVNQYNHHWEEYYINYWTENWERYYTNRYNHYWFRAYTNQYNNYYITSYVNMHNHNYVETYTNKWTDTWNITYSNRYVNRHPYTDVNICNNYQDNTRQNTHSRTWLCANNCGYSYVETTTVNNTVRNWYNNSYTSYNNDWVNGYRNYPNSSKNTSGYNNAAPYTGWNNGWKNHNDYIYWMNGYKNSNVRMNNNGMLYSNANLTISDYSNALPTTQWNNGFNNQGSYENYEYASHTWSTSWTYDTVSHWHVCSTCGSGKGLNAAHGSWSYMNFTNDNHYRYCGTCDYNQSVAHNKYSNWTNGAWTNGTWSSWTSVNITHHQRNRINTRTNTLTYRCYNCQYSYNKTEVNTMLETQTNEHTWGNSTTYVSINATKHNKIYNNRCTECGYYKVTNITESHNWNNGTNYINKNATHHYQNVYKKCNSCSYNNWTNTTPQHTWQFTSVNNTHHNRFCGFCNFTAVTEEHVLNVFMMISPKDSATHYSNVVSECYNCHYSSVDSSVVNHTWSNSIVNYTSINSTHHNRLTNNHCTTSGCGYFTLVNRSLAHNLSTFIPYNSSHHKKTCSECGYNDYENHTMQLFQVEYDTMEHWVVEKCAQCSYQSSGGTNSHYPHGLPISQLQHTLFCDCGYFEYQDHIFFEEGEPCADCGYVYGGHIHSFVDSSYSTGSFTCTICGYSGSSSRTQHSCSGCGSWYVTWLCPNCGSDCVESWNVS